MKKQQHEYSFVIGKDTAITWVLETDDPELVKTFYECERFEEPLALGAKVKFANMGKVGEIKCDKRSGIDKIDVCLMSVESSDQALLHLLSKSQD